MIALALDLRKHRIDAGAARKFKADVEPLSDRNRKTAGADRLDREAVDRDQFALTLAEIDVKIAHRRAIDDAQQQAPARLDFDGLGVGEGAEIGEEGVVFDVVEVGRGGLGRFHARHHHAAALLLAHAGHRARIAQIGVDFLGRSEGEIGQHDDDLLLVGAVALVMDDQRRRH